MLPERILVDSMMGQGRLLPDFQKVHLALMVIYKPKLGWTPFGHSVPREFTFKVAMASSNQPRSL